MILSLGPGVSILKAVAHTNAETPPPRKKAAKRSETRRLKLRARRLKRKKGSSENSSK